MISKRTDIRALFIILVFLGLPVNLWAVDLEEAPDDDLGEVDKAANSMTVEDIRTVKLSDTPGKPVLDGVLDDAFWNDAPLLNIGKELYPVRFTEAIVDTDVLVAVTGTHVYLGITAHDPKPEELRSANRLRDGVKDGDYVSIVIDPTGNLRRKLEFRVNPHGSVTDVLQNTISDRYIYDWDTRWEAAAKITPQGYVVEMEIPFDSIKHPRVEEGKIPAWLVLMKRSYPRAVDRTFGAVYIFQKEDVSGLAAPKKRLELTPYYIFHPDEKRDKDEPFEQIKDHENHDVGGDFKLVIDSATTVSATLNPNYTDVEGDIARDSINNSFTPFKPEKRKFFQDGRDLYSTTMPVVYTRNIVQPEIGLNFSHTGRKVSTGGMWISDESTELIMPDNLGSEKVEITDLPGDLYAARYTTGEKGSSTGIIATARTGEDYYNYVAGIDGLFNLGIDDKLRYQLMYSATDYPEDFAQDLCDGDDCLETPPEDCQLGVCDYNSAVLRADPNSTLEGHGIKLAYKHDGPKSLYWLNYYDYGSDYRADFGFDKRTDYRQISAAYGRKWYVEPFKRDKGKSRIRGYLVGNHIESSSGEQIEDGIDVWGEFRGSFQTVLRVGYRIKERAVNRIQQNTLELGDNAPLFDESYLQWYYEISPINYLTMNLDGRYGDIADSENLVLGDMFELKPKITIRTDKLKFQLSHTYRDYDFENSTLYKENFTTLLIAYHPLDRHVFRLQFLFDQTDRDADRFLADELDFEEENSIELTYVFQKSTGLSILAGAKLQREDDSEINDTFTSEREVYIKFKYDFNVDLFN
jgi:hypothetical protein